ncbi:2391_t:CDS:1 [Funneliformis geosporum]|uniref:RNA helicase n=1 Tax=Funneliformis geosporum TaxID=1117311 RepID=A0A9W4SSW3_9GLOM|nr:15324_t:CDS:1 [Funneliformis geosporum]CAI2183303.1 2391_t:CDS:1 [Funneliformis geosporum]
MDLRSWVSDSVMKLLGMSEKIFIDYIIAEARSCKTRESLREKLEELPQTIEAQRFIDELFVRVPRNKSQKDEAYLKRKREEQEAKETLAKSKSYKLILDDFSFEEPSSKKSKKSKKDKNLRKKEKSNSWESDSDDKKSKSSSSKKRSKYSESDDEYEKEEKEKIKDLKERDEFAKRLRQKDKEKTKKLVEDRSSKAESDAAKRRNLADDAEARRKVLPDIRERSRQEYLRDRTDKQMKMLELGILDEDMLFKGEKLTKKEIRELELKKETLRLTKERLSLSGKTDDYAMPEDYITEKGKIDKKKKETVLYQRYEEDRDQNKFVTDQDQWEQNQIVKSQLKVGAQDRFKQEEQYDYVFDDQSIEFLNWDWKTNNEDEIIAKIDEAEKKAKTIEETRKSLPIYAFRNDLLSAIEEYQVLVIVGETGSGKTTQLPQYLHEAGYTKGDKKVGCTQPRRVAAMSVAARVAEEMGVKLGYEVGYSIRFEDCTSDKTIIKYMTDGMLLREFLTEPLLDGYNCLIIDEAHERTLHTDVLFGLVKDIARSRPDLKLLISSATLDAQKFADYFDGAPIFSIPGKPYPVQVCYTKAPEANYIGAAVTTVMQLHITQQKGDILVFLTGQEEIETVQESLQQACRALGSKIRELIICPIYANLPPDMQGKIFEPTPPGARKVILATNIAETSITIDGVSFVIDPGFVKQNFYSAKTRMESLEVVTCSRASATQRAGRAGRVGPGHCFRLYTKHAYGNEMEENNVPEIKRTNLGHVVLLLKSIGIRDVMSFEFMDPPHEQALISALKDLSDLGALNNEGELTKLGRRMAEYPLDPVLSKTIITSEKYHCSEEVISIISMLNVQSSVFYRPKDKKFHADKARQNFTKSGGDHFTLLNVWEQWVDTNYSLSWCHENFIVYRSMTRARDVRDQLVGLCERTEVKLESNPNPADIVPIQKSFVAGFFMNTAKLLPFGDSYQKIKFGEAGRRIHIHPSSSLFQTPPKWVLYYELVATQKDYMRQVMEIQPQWLTEAAPACYTKAELDKLDSKKKMPKNHQVTGSPSLSVI